MPTPFETLYASLNPAQQTAVSTLEGPVLVLAGPGTGKTQVLAARVAYILQETDSRPESILALTFTESAAKNMRERLVRMIGTAAYYVQIETFHSFCAGVIAAYPEYFYLPRESSPLSDIERFEIMENLFDSLDLPLLRPRRAPYFFVRDTIKAISDLKREGISPERFQEVVATERATLEAERPDLKKTELSQRDKNCSKQEELVKIYVAYQTALEKRARFDYDDMISLVGRAFTEHEILLLQYQENIHYFLVDEYQDTNSAQNAIVDQLAQYWGPEANVFVVGDPNQAIYRFQGASLENVLGFVERYPTATVIGLTQGYRAPQGIYDAAARLISENQDVLPAAVSASSRKLLEQYTAASHLTSMQQENKAAAAVELYRAPSQTLESIYVVERVAELLANGVEPQEIAVLSRTNAQAVQYAAAFEKWSIPIELDGSRNALEVECIQQLLTLCRVIHDLNQGVDAPDLYRVLQFEWFELPSLLLLQVARRAHDARMSIQDLIQAGYENFASVSTGPTVSALEFSLLESAFFRLQTWGVLDARVVFTEWLHTVLNESGFMKWVQTRVSKVDDLSAVQSLLREVTGLVEQNHDLRLSDFLNYIAVMREHHISLSIEPVVKTAAAVRVSTVHKAKGQEWKHVFIVGLVDGTWGNTKKRELLPLPDGILQHTVGTHAERTEDDRRLLFVALTRAKEQVHLSYPEVQTLENRNREVSPSLFLAELAEHIVPAPSQLAQTVADKADDHLARLLGMPPAPDYSAAEKEYFRYLVSEFKLSVSGLNTYLRDPEAFVLRYLLKVPEAKSVPLAFGTAIHAALQHSNTHLQKAQELPPLSSVHTVFERALHRELLLEQDYERELLHGKSVLSAFFETHAAQNSQGHFATMPLHVERFFGSGRAKPYLEDIPLTGRLDRIDTVDARSRTVRVIDYKTGNTKSESELSASSNTALGKLSPREQSLPESVRSPYQRQLLFYKLLTDLDQSFEYTAVQGSFIFVEPEKRTGKFVERAHTYTEEELLALSQLIKEVMTEIRSLAFLNSASVQ